MADITSLGLTKPTLNEFYDLLVQNGNIDLLDQLIAARVEKTLIAHNLLTTNADMILGADQGPVIQGKFDEINNNLAEKSYVAVSASCTVISGIVKSKAGIYGLIITLVGISGEEITGDITACKVSVGAGAPSGIYVPLSNICLSATGTVIGSAQVWLNDSGGIRVRGIPTGTYKMSISGSYIK